MSDDEYGDDDFVDEKQQPAAVANPPRRPIIVTQSDTSTSKPSLAPSPKSSTSSTSTSGGRTLTKSEQSQLQTLRSSITTDPGFLEPYVLLARLYTQIGDERASKGVLEQGMERFPKEKNMFLHLLNTWSFAGSNRTRGARQERTALKKEHEKEVERETLMRQLEKEVEEEKQEMIRKKEQGKRKQQAVAKGSSKSSSRSISRVSNQPPQQQPQPPQLVVPSVIVTPATPQDSPKSSVTTRTRIPVPPPARSNTVHSHTSRTSSRLSNAVAPPSRSRSHQPSNIPMPMSSAVNLVANMRSNLAEIRKEAKRQLGWQEKEEGGKGKGISSNNSENGTSREQMKEKKLMQLQAHENTSYQTHSRQSSNSHHPQHHHQIQQASNLHHHPPPSSYSLLHANPPSHTSVPFSTHKQEYTTAQQQASYQLSKETMQLLGKQQQKSTKQQGPMLKPLPINDGSSSARSADGRDGGGKGAAAPSESAQASAPASGIPVLNGQIKSWMNEPTASTTAPPATTTESSQAYNPYAQFMKQQQQHEQQQQPSYQPYPSQPYPPQQQPYPYHAQYGSVSMQQQYDQQQYDQQQYAYIQQQQQYAYEQQQLLLQQQQQQIAMQGYYPSPVFIAAAPPSIPAPYVSPSPPPPQPSIPSLPLSSVPVTYPDPSSLPSASSVVSATSASFASQRKQTLKEVGQRRAEMMIREAVEKRDREQEELRKKEVEKERMKAHAAEQRRQKAEKEAESRRVQALEEMRIRREKIAEKEAQFALEQAKLAASSGNEKQPTKSLKKDSSSSGLKSSASSSSLASAALTPRSQLSKEKEARTRAEAEEEILRLKTELGIAPPVIVTLVNKQKSVVPATKSAPVVIKPTPPPPAVPVPVKSPSPPVEETHRITAAKIEAAIEVERLKAEVERRISNMMNSQQMKQATVALLQVETPPAAAAPIVPEPVIEPSAAEDTYGEEDFVQESHQEVIAQPEPIAVAAATAIDVPTETPAVMSEPLAGQNPEPQSYVEQPQEECQGYPVVADTAVPAELGDAQYDASSYDQQQAVYTDQQYQQQQAYYDTNIYYDSNGVAYDANGVPLEPAPTATVVVTDTIVDTQQEHFSQPPAAAAPEEPVPTLSSSYDVANTDQIAQQYTELYDSNEYSAQYDVVAQPTVAEPAPIVPVSVAPVAAIQPSHSTPRIRPPPPALFTFEDSLGPTSVQHAAATKIQNAQRARVARGRVKELREERMRMKKVIVEEEAVPKQSTPAPRIDSPVPLELVTIQAEPQPRYRKTPLLTLDPSFTTIGPSQREHDAARKIQSLQRGLVARKEVKKKKEEKSWRERPPPESQQQQQQQPQQPQPRYRTTPIITLDPSLTSFGPSQHEHNAATKIQALQRGKVGRQSVVKKLVEKHERAMEEERKRMEEEAKSDAPAHEHAHVKFAATVDSTEEEEEAPFEVKHVESITTITEEPQQPTLAIQISSPQPPSRPLAKRVTEDDEEEEEEEDLGHLVMEDDADVLDFSHARKKKAQEEAQAAAAAAAAADEEKAQQATAAATSSSVAEHASLQTLKVQQQDASSQRRNNSGISVRQVSGIGPSLGGALNSGAAAVQLPSYVPPPQQLKVNNIRALGAGDWNDASKISSTVTEAQQSSASLFDEYASFSLEIIALDRVGKLGQTKPYVTIQHQRAHIWEDIHKTETILRAGSDNTSSRTVNPHYETTIIRMSSLNHTHTERINKYQLKHQDSMGQDITIGELQMSWKEIMKDWAEFKAQEQTGEKFRIGQRKVYYLIRSEKNKSFSRPSTDSYRKHNLLYPSELKNIPKNCCGCIIFHDVSVRVKTTPALLLSSSPRLFPSDPNIPPQINSNITSCYVRLNIHGKGLDKMDVVGLSDPFFQLWKHRPNSLVAKKVTTADNANDDDLTQYEQVYESDYIEHTLDPKFPTFVVPASKLCNNNYDTVLLLRMYDYDSTGEPDYIGSSYFTLREIIYANDEENAKTDPSLTNKRPLVNPHKLANDPKKYKNSGMLTIRGCDVFTLVSDVDEQSNKLLASQNQVYDQSGVKFGITQRQAYLVYLMYGQPILKAQAAAFFKMNHRSRASGSGVLLGDDAGGGGGARDVFSSVMNKKGGGRDGKRSGGGSLFDLSLLEAGTMEEGDEEAKSPAAKEQPSRPALWISTPDSSSTTATAASSSPDAAREESKRKKDRRASRRASHGHDSIDSQPAVSPSHAQHAHSRSHTTMAASSSGGTDSAAEEDEAVASLHHTHKRGKSTGGSSNSGGHSLTHHGSSTSNGSNGGGLDALTKSMRNAADLFAAARSKDVPLAITFKAKDLPKSGLFSSPSTYLEILADKRLKQNWEQVIQSEIVESTTSPTYPPLQFKQKNFVSSRTSHGAEDGVDAEELQTICIKVWQSQKKELPKLIGLVQTSFAALRSIHTKLQLINPITSSTECGVILIDSVKNVAGSVVDAKEKKKRKKHSSSNI